MVTGGYRRLPRGSAHFSFTNTQTLHHNIYIIIAIIIIIFHSLEVCGPIGEGGWRALADALRLLPPLVLQVEIEKIKI